METTFQKISRKSGRKPTECKCQECKSQCRIAPCLGTPEDITKLIAAGYEDRLSPTEWRAGMLMGVIDRPVNMIQATQEKGGCTFFKDGLCELHDKGLKPTEGRLSNHATRIDNFDPKKSLSWLIAKEWLELKEIQ